MKIAAALLVVLLALLPVCTGLGMDPSVEPFQEVRARAKRLERTAEGKAYEERFAKGFEKSLRNALHTCTQDLPLSTPFGLVLVIAADGTIERIVAEPGQAVAECLALKLQGVKLAAPPKAGWLVLVKVAA